MQSVWVLYGLVSLVGAQNTSYGSLPKGNYSELTLSESSSLSHLFVMAEGFVNIVFPSIDNINGYISKIVNSNDAFSTLTSEWQSLLKLEAGFLACVVFGFLFIIFVPIVGLFMFCCRTFCQNCGGKMSQTTHRSQSCWRSCFCFTLLILDVFMTIPTIFVFLTNGWITNILTAAPENSQVAIGNGIEYIHSINHQMQYVQNQYNKFDEELRIKISDFGSNAGSDAADLALEQAKPALDAFDDVIAYVNELKLNLTNVKTSTSTLLDGVNLLDERLSNQTAKMQAGLINCADFLFDPYCYSVLNSTHSLKLQVNSGIIIDLLNKTTDIITELQDLGLAEKRNSTTSILNDVSERVKNETQKLIADATTELDNANTTFQSILANIPTNTLSNATAQMQKISDEIPGYFKAYTDNFDNYRYIAGLVLAIILLVIVILYYVGICLGVWGHRNQLTPDQRTTLSNTGGLALMSGVGFSFIFSWLFMILVLITFTIGGHLERYVCQSLSKPYKGIELVEQNVNIPKLLGFETNVSVTDVINNCEKDMSLYNAFYLDSLFDIDTLINDVKTKLDFTQILDNATFDLDLNLYNNEIRDLLDKVNVSEINDLDVADLQSQAANATSPSLLNYANFLNESANNYSASAAAEKALTYTYSNEILKMQEENVDPLVVKVDQLTDQLNAMKKSSSEIEVLIEALRTKLQEVDAVIATNATKLVKDAILPTITDITNHVVVFIDWTVMQIKDHFGACKPVVMMYNQVVSLLCKYIVDTINGLWFSLGWCAFLLIPSAIIAMKLAKFYRRMSYSEDEADYFDEVQMNYFSK